MKASLLWLPLTVMPFTVLFLDHTDRPECTHIVFFTITSPLTSSTLAYVAHYWPFVIRFKGNLICEHVFLSSSVESE